MTEIHFSSLNKDDIVEENPLGDMYVVPHVITQRKLPLRVLIIHIGNVHFLFWCLPNCQTKLIKIKLHNKGKYTVAFIVSL